MERHSRACDRGSCYRYLARAPGRAANHPAVIDTGPEFATPTTLDQIGRIVAPVMINGRGPFKLMVDTGANRSLITTTVADALGIDYLNAPLVTMNGVTGSAVVPAVAIERLEAGELVFEGLQVPVLPRISSAAWTASWESRVCASSGWWSTSIGTG